MLSERKEVEPHPALPLVGCTLFREPSDWQSQDEHYNAWHDLVSQMNTQDIPLEIQYESYYETGYWQNIIELLKTNISKPSVHAPIKGRDIASGVETIKNFSVNETRKAMDFADLLNSPVFVLHLTPQDDWGNRDKQLEIGLRSFNELTEYKTKKGYRFQTLLETLEFPKWPSSEGETIMVLREAKSIDPNVGFCVDIPHLWHNLVWLSPKADRNIDFPKKLREYLKTIQQLVPIKRFHFAGAYVEFSEKGEIHQTHGIPGYYHPESLNLYYNLPPADFNGVWMPINESLLEIKHFLEKYDPTDKSNLDIILEIHETNMDKQNNSVKFITSEFKTV